MSPFNISSRVVFQQLAVPFGVYCCFPWYSGRGKCSEIKMTRASLEKKQIVNIFLFRNVLQLNAILRVRVKLMRWNNKVKVWDSCSSVRSLYLKFILPRTTNTDNQISYAGPRTKPTYPSILTIKHTATAASTQKNKMQTSITFVMFCIKFRRRLQI